MQGLFEIRSVENRSGKSNNTGKEYSINTAYVIDSQAQRPAILQMIVNDEDVQAVKTLVGKTVQIDVTLTDKGRMYFNRQVVQAAPKLVNS